MANSANRKLRCTEGDLALVIREEPGCDPNVGLVVVVSGPVLVSRGLGPCWLIEPVTPEPWSVYNPRERTIWRGPITFEHMIDHPDAWLLPLRPKEELDWLAQSVIGRRPIKLGKDKVVDLAVFLEAVECEDVADLRLPFEMSAEEWGGIRAAWLRQTEGGTNLLRPFSRQAYANRSTLTNRLFPQHWSDRIAVQPAICGVEKPALELAREAIEAPGRTPPREAPEGIGLP